MRATASAGLILCVGVFLLFTSMLYPPWVAYTRNAYGGLTELPCGYGFLFTQPSPKTTNVSIKIDFAGLFIEWAIVLAGGAVCLVLAKREAARPKRENHAQTAPPEDA